MEFVRGYDGKHGEDGRSRSDVTNNDENQGKESDDSWRSYFPGEDQKNLIGQPDMHIRKGT